ncbi:hypothetical protein [Corynebacterium pygosceleis]|uniref:YbjN domain-containing protein n=1 Tax=Corynebacterium pygosceleis TaxID=2800406 RepID=A0A9Q4GI84_9CORY|nr:hypothetical protein [Corynebacterium pygosceleis]MCK7637518.1 hypothetical protein [Corynebacterium pygosceleis]MCK7674705.1 hypothetical protein [Corynebacterium pygosceleis]MCL0119706.1 hypothetical protein [Corynebacterium pygosceleis]MCX7468153.1 hypothetical protein [Corynebacterium pygosceleis]
MTSEPVSPDRSTLHARLLALGLESGTRDGELIVTVENLTFWFRTGTDSSLTVTTAHPRVLGGENEITAGEILASALNTVSGNGRVVLLPDVGLLTVSFDLDGTAQATAGALDEFILSSLSRGVVTEARIREELDPLILRVAELTGS